MDDQHQETVKAIGDGLSVATVVGTLLEVLPAVAALFTIIWTGMRITEMVVGKPFSEIIRRSR